MTIHKFKAKPAQEDGAVASARRRETLRGALKMMRVLLHAVQRHADWTRARHGVDSTQLWVLWELARAPGLRGVDVARNLAIHRQRAEQLMHELARLGLVRVESGPERPSPAHFLTATGQRVADAAAADGQGVMLSAMERLSDPALDQVVRALRDLVEQLPMRDDRAALSPLADLLRQPAESASPLMASPGNPADKEN